MELSRNRNISKIFENLCFIFFFAKTNLMIEKNIKQPSIKKGKKFEFLNNSLVSGPIILKGQSIEISFLYFVINNFLNFPRHRLNQYLHNYLLLG